MDATKHCAHCGSVMESSRRGRVRRYCSPRCRAAAASARYYARHAERALERNRKYADTERGREYQRAYRAKNAGRLREYYRIHYAENAERLREHQRDRNSTPRQREANELYNRAKRAHRHGVQISYVPNKRSFGDDCFYCGADVDFEAARGANAASLDHLTPLARGGSHTTDNVVLSCQSCNAKKRTRTAGEYFFPEN